MQFANAILQQSAVILLIDFAVNQMKVVPASSVDVTSDKTAVRFCAFFGYFFCASKKSDWPAGQKHGNGKRSTKNKAPPRNQKTKKDANGAPKIHLKKPSNQKT